MLNKFFWCFLDFILFSWSCHNEYVTIISFDFLFMKNIRLFFREQITFYFISWQMQYHHKYIVDLHNINDRIDFIMTNASINLRSIFFNDDYRSTTDENWIKTFSFFFLSHWIKIRVDIIFVQHETSWYEMSRKILMIKIIQINQVIKILE
jgi:hypothetical protein